MSDTCPIDRLPPSQWWRYAICHDGPLDGQVRDIPSFALAGRVVTWDEGRYEVGLMDKRLLVRHCFYIFEDD